MGTKIFGIIASATIVVVIALSLINFGNYHSLLPERPAEAIEEVAEVVADEQNDVEPIDSTTVEMVDSLALAVAPDTLKLEQ